MLKHFAAGLIGATMMVSSAHAAPVYLNISNISVAVGANTSPGTYNNTFSGGQTIDKVIDAPTATATEFHNQTTHIWYTANEAGGGLELVFDFGINYDITTLHFWNYTAESYDVDQIDFSFFDQGGTNVGNLTVNPALGSAPGIAAEDIVLAAPLNIRTVTAFLTGTNRQVDFQNIGFTAEVSAPTTEMPEPGTLAVLGLGLAGLAWARRRKTA